MLPKTGNSLRGSQSRKKLNIQYALAIAKALDKQLGKTHQATKTVMRWTGASENSAKNWRAGAAGPSGAYLIVLMSQSEEVPAATLALAGQKQGIFVSRLYALKDLLNDLVQLIDSLWRRDVGSVTDERYGPADRATR